MWVSSDQYLQVVFDCSNSSCPTNQQACVVLWDFTYVFQNKAESPMHCDLFWIVAHIETWLKALHTELDNYNIFLEKCLDEKEHFFS